MELGSLVSVGILMRAQSSTDQVLILNNYIKMGMITIINPKEIFTQSILPHRQTLLTKWTTQSLGMK